MNDDGNIVEAKGLVKKFEELVVDDRIAVTNLSKRLMAPPPPLAARSTVSPRRVFSQRKGPVRPPSS
jgi:hypothetical protein